MNVLVIEYGDRYATPAVFKDKAALLAAHDAEFHAELGKAADVAIANPRDAVDAGDGDSLYCLPVIGASD